MGTPKFTKFNDPKTARELLKAAEVVIWLTIDKDGRAHCASYGRDRNLCSMAESLADELFETAEKWMERKVQQAKMAVEKEWEE